MIERSFVVGKEYHFIGIETDSNESCESHCLSGEGLIPKTTRGVVLKKLRCESKHDVPVLRGTAKADGFIFKESGSSVEYRCQYPVANYRQESVNEDQAVRSEQFSGLTIDVVYSGIVRKLNSGDELSSGESSIITSLNNYIESNGLSLKRTEASLLYPDDVLAFIVE